MSSIRLFACFALLAASSLPALSQPTPAGPPCAAASGASAPAPGCGPGARGPRGRWGPSNTSGWPMMTPAERQAHHDRMNGFKSYEECRAYLDQHHQDMVARAKERGIQAPTAPRRDGCAGLKSAKS